MKSFPTQSWIASGYLYKNCLLKINPLSPNLQYLPPEQLTELFELYINENIDYDPNIIHNFITNGIDIHYDNDQLLCTAVMNNNLILTSLLLNLNANLLARKNFCITIIDFWISCGYSDYIPMQNLLKQNL